MKNLIRNILREQIDNKIEIEEFPYGDFIVYKGGNAESNDYLTFEKANDNDIWLHTKDYPGSHIILSMSSKNYPTDDVLYFAASIAKKYSKGKNKDNVKVVYCYVSDVFKTSDMKVGQVDVDTSKLNVMSI